MRVVLALAIILVVAAVVVSADKDHKNNKERKRSGNYHGKSERKHQGGQRQHKGGNGNDKNDREKQQKDDEKHSVPFNRIKTGNGKKVQLRSRSENSERQFPIQSPLKNRNNEDIILAESCPTDLEMRTCASCVKLTCANVDTEKSKWKACMYNDHGMMNISPSDCFTGKKKWSDCHCYHEGDYVWNEDSNQCVLKQDCPKNAEPEQGGYVAPI